VSWSLVVSGHSTCQKSNSFPYRQIVLDLSVPCDASSGVSRRTRFTGWACRSHAQSPTWRTRVSLSVWVITFDLSGKGDPASRYATAGVALGILWPRKHHHHVKVRIPPGGIYFILLDLINPVLFGEELVNIMELHIMEFFPVTFYCLLLRVRDILSSFSVHWNTRTEFRSTVFTFKFSFKCKRTCHFITCHSSHRGGTEVWLYSFLTSALDGGRLSTPQPSHFTPGKSAGTHCTRRLAGPQGRSGRLRVREIVVL
jgi:hypothetical protein